MLHLQFQAEKGTLVVRKGLGFFIYLLILLELEGAIWSKCHF